ncbi:MAG: hypothetical protein A3I07_03635 [Candidatus Doudnabacteria bacterium RIFCSPLOWO2_02_FULL_42_9]|uniref:Uncharacterized protein n=1 Tax=Candidatus Doudnabacteria bacterium RIFCSPHIGHO2_01_FULL_41_86 TaxID=1817821 RepID=A0A1F5N9M4_9BACT|nr:MAG: hypothetical protein A2717_02395 [Candidatus Doudnabacteria bacterium RIFCSPHIGHO2_01_FULL_41_86]OGE75611.1 MAG: hypothetical protein A3K07_02155 [Candidatus Doudnabacteria bacterium RIFCSPHIGHO2_01_43_10]OGE85406.1 MAG: hypothetical protein A3E28_01965 [Candidatus Doudnabacteria bacterium RIFCSPHIGHO2_12_FULL_42_22]OGE86944.1 MAG: hypothetical protein A3C49_02800 [Candidatus Doudnabacteria bacterium RIFCSPHIGHO2_02_FULL_42_25]OGE92543.1 MAG: hypothetical protein A2895_02955 [Candidatus
MDLDRWEQVKENIKNNFQVLEEGSEDLTVGTADGDIKSGTAQFLVAETPMGKIKLAFESRPVVTDKKFIYSHRAGQAARTEYQFSDTEMTYKIKAYKLNDDEEWEEIDAANFN